MKSVYIVFYLLFVVSSFAHAVNNESKSGIEGKVVNSYEEALPYASVALYNAEDSSLISGSVTDESGNFTISTKKGNYYLIISFLSYEKKVISDIVIDGKETFNVGKVMLSENAELLNEVEIVEKKSEVQLHLDKKVFIVGSDISNTGGSAADVLTNVPSVEVDVDGNVSLRGSENVQLLIDGKQSGLTGIGSSDALRHLQGSMIEKVEVITNPSAKYDAEGEVGILNIVLKKDKRSGFNGSFEVVAGYPENFSTSFNVNYRKEKYNLFTSYGVNYRKNPGFGFSTQQFTYPDTSFSYNTRRDHKRGGLGNNLRFGSDFFINPTNTLTAAFIVSYSKGNNEAITIFEDLDNEGNIFKETVRTDDEVEVQKDFELDLRYEKKFDKEDQVFTADFKWSQGDDTEESDLMETYSNSATSLIQRSSNIEDQRNYLLQADYAQPVGTNGKFETGVKATIRKIINDYLVEELNQNEQWNPLPGFNNEFIYFENIYAAYVTYENKTGNFNYQFGLRSEYSDVSTNLLETNEVNDRNYIDFFPTAHFSYELSRKNTLQLSYSRRISRPRFRYLLPFFNFTNPRNFYGGNPDIDPEYTHSIEAGYLKRFEKGSILANIYYRKQDQVIQWYTVADTAGNTVRFPINAGMQDDVGLEVNITYQVTDWWRLNISGNYYYFDQEGEFEGEILRSSSDAFTMRANTNFTVFDKVDIQSSFSYRAPRDNPQGRTLSRYAWDVGASIDILKNRGTLTFSGRDILNTRIRRSTVSTPTLESVSEFQWRSRQFSISFIYRINQKKKRSYGGGGMMNDDF